MTAHPPPLAAIALHAHAALRSREARHVTTCDGDEDMHRGLRGGAPGADPAI